MKLVCVMNFFCLHNGAICAPVQHLPFNLCKTHHKDYPLKFHSIEINGNINFIKFEMSKLAMLKSTSDKSFLSKSTSSSFNSDFCRFFYLHDSWSTDHQNPLNGLKHLLFQISLKLVTVKE